MTVCVHMCVKREYVCLCMCKCSRGCVGTPAYMWHPYVCVYVCVIVCISVCLYHPPSPPLRFPPTSILFPQSPCSFKPVDVGHLVTPLREHFEFLFRRSFSIKRNKEFLEHIQVGRPAMCGCVLCTEWCVDCNCTGRQRPQAAMGDSVLGL